MHAIPRRARRLVCFVAGSLALHALTLVGFVPAGVASAPHRGTAEPQILRATLNARDSLAADGSLATSRESTAGQGEASLVEAKADARMGVAGGADLPFPDKWYSATEVDVRAEPLAEVRVEYPEELEGSGIPGRVRLMLFVDERGVVRRVVISEAEPARLFDNAATRAWTDVKFSPAKKAGVAVKSQKLLELNFWP